MLRDAGWVCVFPSVCPLSLPISWPWRCSHSFQVFDGGSNYGANDNESVIRCILYQHMTEFRESWFSSEAGFRTTGMVPLNYLPSLLCHFLWCVLCLPRDSNWFLLGNTWSMKWSEAAHRVPMLQLLPWGKQLSPEHEGDVFFQKWGERKYCLKHHHPLTLIILCLRHSTRCCVIYLYSSGPVTHSGQNLKLPIICLFLCAENKSINPLG